MEQTCTITKYINFENKSFTVGDSVSIKSRYGWNICGEIKTIDDFLHLLQIDNITSIPIADIIHLQKYD